jgi:hypothetical protein
VAGVRDPSVHPSSIVERRYHHSRDTSLIISVDAEFSDLLDQEKHHRCVLFTVPGTVLLNHLLVFSILCTYLTVRVGLRMVWHFLRDETPI